MKRLFLFFAVLSFLASSCFGMSRQRVILDADTANEVDDLYALVRALIEPSWEIVALNATHWQTSQWATDTTMEDSHRLNQMLLGWLDLDSEIPTRRGGHFRMYDWGDRAQHSAAAYGLIRDAHATPEGEKLWVVALGALTNVASALTIDPTIAPKIAIFWLGSSIDFETGQISTLDFNAMMDPQAVHVVFQAPVELHVLPKQVSSLMIFDYNETVERLRGKHPLADLLVDRWTKHQDGGRYQRHIWDLAVVGAMLFPEHATRVAIQTSREYGAREVFYWKTLDIEHVREEFFETTLAYLLKLDSEG